MLNWLSGTMATIIVTALLILITALCILNVVKSHRSGGCNGNCAGCVSGSCSHITFDAEDVINSRKDLK